MNPDDLKKERKRGARKQPSSPVEVPPGTPQWLEQLTPERRTVVEVANALLIDDEITAADSERTDAELGELIQERFQEALRNFYRTSGLADQIAALRVTADIQGQGDNLDIKACNVVARASEGVHGWVDILPKLKQLNQASGMNCTLGSAMLHCALEDLGFTDVRTVLRAGHHVVMCTLPDGGMTIYDATSLSTQNDELVGYTRTFSKDAVRNVQPVQEHGNRSGMAFTLVSAQRDSIGGFSAETGSQAYAQQFYGYDQSIIMDVAIALENLSEIKADASQIETDAEDRVFNEDAYKQAGVEYIQQNNVVPLTSDDITELARSNRQPIEELLQAARRAFSEQGEPPNPFDYLTGEKIQPKQTLEPVPDPNQYQGSSERYQQAKALVQRFPQLQQLDFATTKHQFDLLDGYELIGERICASAPEVSWERVSLIDELGELERTAEDLGIPLERLTAAFAQAEVETLSDADWERTLNCDSSDTSWTFDDAREYLRGKRNFAAIVTGFNLGVPMPTPVVLYRPGEPPYLIGGSSRLLGCRVMNKRPKVLALRLE